MKVAIYARVSVSDANKDKQRDSESIDTQETRCRQHAASAGLEIYRVYKDDGRSGKDLNRPALQELLADSQAGKFEGVLLTRIDRLSRDAGDTANLLKMFRLAGIAAMPLDDTLEETASGNMMTNVKASFSQFFRELTRENTLKTLEKRAKSGKRNGGYAPYGYDIKDDGLSVNAAQAAIVQEIFATYLRENSLRKTAYLLNERGFRTHSGSAWNGSSLRYILQNPIYLGRMVWRRRSHSPNEWIDVEETHPAIITQETFDAVNALLRSNKDKPTRRGELYLLRGLARCGKCGAKLTRHRNVTRGQTWEYMACSSVRQYGKKGCGLKLFPFFELERIVMEKLTALSQDAAFLRDKAAILQAMKDAIEGDGLHAKKDALQKQASAISRKMSRLLTLFEESEEQDTADFKARYAELKQEFAQTQQQIADVEQAQASAGEVLHDMQKSFDAASNFDAAGWGEWDLEQRHHYLKMMIDAIILHDNEVEIRLKVDNLELLRMTGFADVSSPNPQTPHFCKFIINDFYALTLPVKRQNGRVL